MFDPNSQQSTLSQVDAKAEQYMNNPQALQQKYQQNQQLIDLLALQKIKSQKEAAAREMQLQMAQQSGQPQTIAQQREQQVLDMTKQEMIENQKDTLGNKQQEQQKNLQQVLKGMSQGAPQPPQQGVPGMPQPQSAPPQQGGQPGVPGLPTGNLMPPKAMAGGGIVAFDEGGDVADWEEEWKRRQRQLGGKDPIEGEEAQSWFERNVYDPRKKEYLDKRKRAARAMMEDSRPGIFTPTTQAERDAYEAKRAIIRDMNAGKYDPTGKPLVPMIGNEKQADVYARMDAAKLGTPPVPAEQPQAQPGIPGLKQPPKPGLPQPQAQQQQPKPGFTQPPAGGLQSIMEQAAQKQVQRDPQAEADAYRAKANTAMGYSPEEKAKFEANQKAMEDYDKQMFDPEKMRKEQLSDFLIGAAGRSTIGMTLGAAGKAGSTRRRQQELMQREAMGDRQKNQEGFLETGRKSREDAFKSGDTALKEAQSGINQGLSSGTAMVDMDKQMASAGLDRASREKIANINAAVQREVNVAMKENTLTLNRQTLLANIDKAEESALATAKKSSPEYSLLKQLSGIEAMSKLDKDQIAKKQAAETKLDAIEIAIKNKFQETRDMVMSSGGGLGSLPTGTKGWGKLEEVKPTKK